MKTIIEAPGLDYQPKLVETENGWATVYGHEVKEFKSFESALFEYKGILNHAASLSALLGDE